MKPLSTFFIFLLFLSGSPVIAKTGNGTDSIAALQKEVVRLCQKNQNVFPDIDEQDVTVGFLINAKNELVILDVNGESETACEYVKQILNFQKVKYRQAKQLTRYTITIHLVKDYQ